MSGSHKNQRFAFVALGMALLAIVLASWLSQPADKQKTQQDATTTEYSQEQYGPAEGRWWPEFSARDTYAQWVMAALSVVATGFSVWAVFLVRDSLALNRDAVKAARDAIGVERAWLTISEFDGGPIMVADVNGESSKTIAFRLIWKNTGRSPATNLSVFVSYGIAPHDQPIPFFDAHSHADNFVTRTHVGVGDTISTLRNTIKPEDAVLLKDFLVYCVVRYSDIYSSAVRQSEFCGRVTFHQTKYPDKDEVFTEFDLHPVGPQNGLT